MLVVARRLLVVPGAGAGALIKRREADPWPRGYLYILRRILAPWPCSRAAGRLEDPETRGL